jgi:MFS family permease
LYLGWFGFGQAIAIMVGSLTMGYIADHRRFQRSFKSLILISLILCFIICLLFQLSVRTILWPNNPIIPSSSVSIGILLSITGLFFGAAFPLFYESLAEIMHPLPESLSTSILVEFVNIVSLIFLAIAPNRYKLVNLLVLLMIGISILMVACARIKYKRKDEELRKVEEQGYEFNQNTSTV